MGGSPSGAVRAGPELSAGPCRLRAAGALVLPRLGAVWSVVGVGAGAGCSAVCVFGRGRSRSRVLVVRRRCPVAGADLRVQVVWPPSGAVRSRLLVLNGVMSAHSHDDIDSADRLAQLRMADALAAGALAPVARRLLGRVPGRPTVLDVGCGAGGMSVLFARELARGDGGTVVLLDATPELLAEARRAVTEAAGGGVEVVGVHGDLADPRVAERVPAADLVWASGVVHHVGDQQAALCALARLLRPGGVLAIG